MVTWFADKLPIITLGWGFAYLNLYDSTGNVYWEFYSEALAPTTEKDALFKFQDLCEDDNTPVMAWATIGLSVLFLIPFVQAIIYKFWSLCIKVGENTENNEIYVDQFLSFKEDYDRLNPHSKKKGQMRLIHQRISQANTTMPDPELLARLTKLYSDVG